MKWGPRKIPIPDHEKRKCHISGPISILYDRETWKQMRSAGCTIKVDGKVFRQ